MRRAERLRISGERVFLKSKAERPLSFLYVRMVSFLTMQSFDKTQDTFLRENLKWYMLAGIFLANVLIWNVLITETKSNVLTVAFLDVGQGDAILTPVTQYTS